MNIAIIILGEFICFSRYRFYYLKHSCMEETDLYLSKGSLHRKEYNLLDWNSNPALRFFLFQAVIRHTPDNHLIFHDIRLHITSFRQMSLRNSSINWCAFTFLPTYLPTFGMTIISFLSLCEGPLFALGLAQISPSLRFMY